jgi:hypothetical protein
MEEGTTCSTLEEALRYAEIYGFPVELRAPYVLYGWRRRALDKEQLERLFKEGKSISPVARVDLFFPNLQ